MLNPYQPPTSDSALLEPSTATAAESRSLPRDFWFLWMGWIILCLFVLITILFESDLASFARSLLGWPIMGLGIAPFVLIRAKLCERYQHRCIASSGLVVFFACFGVCFGLGYACLGVWFVLFSVMSWMLQTTSLSDVQWIAILFTAFVALVIYLKLIDMSARRPRLNATPTNEHTSFNR